MTISHISRLSSDSLDGAGGLGGVGGVWAADGLVADLVADSVNGEKGGQWSVVGAGEVR